MLLAALTGCEEAHGEAAVTAADGGADDAATGSEAGSGGIEAPAAGSGGEAEAGAGGKAAADGGGSGGAGTRGGAGTPAGRGGSTAGASGSPGGGGGTAAMGAGGRRCGTRGGVTCGGEQFCNFGPDADCGATDRGGVCEPKPQACPQNYAPVCGCDDRTYGNACAAHGAGVSVQSEGECTKMSGGGGTTCGGFAALECDGNQFCNYETAAGGQGCDGTIADAAGVCQPTPQACTRDLRPVCSCDRRSFSNRCTANAEGASVLHEGACTEVDCEAIGGRVVYGTGPAAMCPRGETEHTWVTNADGPMPIEGAVCCL